ncbi:MAG TPA: zinc-binding dehydrogenase [Candidatus Dormibacteraeota bacterium]|jgi:threonine dehydrogenase-like Zn-dependent dehydrogenase
MSRGTTTVLAGIEQTRMEEYELPRPASGDVLMEMIRANICGSELHIWRGLHPQVGIGGVLGHEGLGRVVALGEGVTHDFAGEPLREGDRAVATYYQVCRRCPECQNGDWNLCRNAYEHWRKPAVTFPHFHGTFGTHYYVHRDQYLYRVPDAVSDRSAASANCALSQMVYSVHVSGLRPGETVLLLGAGGLGLCGAAAASATDARVLVADVNPRRLEIARDFGADATLDLSELAGIADRADAVRARCGGRLPDVVIDVTGTPSAFWDGARLTRAGGRFVSVGNISPGKTCEFDPGLFTRSGVTIVAAIRYHPFFLGRALEFVATHPQFPWESLLDADYPLSSVDLALRHSADRVVTRASLVAAGGGG